MSYLLIPPPSHYTYRDPGDTACLFRPASSSYLPPQASTTLSPRTPDDTGDAPFASLATLEAALPLPTSVSTFSTKAEREQWSKANLPSPVLVHLNQPFGKDRINQSFTLQAPFRHVLCALIKSGFLPDHALAALEAAYARSRCVYQACQIPFPR